MTKKKNQGFTLVDMMFTIAIIGVLSAIAVPKFSKMMAKARTVEAKVALSTLYTLEQSFMMDWNAYTVDLKNVGFQQNGERLRYAIGFLNAGEPLKVCNNYPTSAPLENPPVGGADSNSFNLSTANAINKNGSTWGEYGDSLYIPSNTIFLNPVPVSVCESASGAQFFKAHAIGNPSTIISLWFFPVAVTKSFPVESWTINSKKIISLEGRSLYSSD